MLVAKPKRKSYKRSSRPPKLKLEHLPFVSLGCNSGFPEFNERNFGDPWLSNTSDRNSPDLVVHSSFISRSGEAEGCVLDENLPEEWIPEIPDIEIFSQEFGLLTFSSDEDSDCSVQRFTPAKDQFGIVGLDNYKDELQLSKAFDRQQQRLFPVVDPNLVIKLDICNYEFPKDRILQTPPNLSEDEEQTGDGPTDKRIVIEKSDELKV